MLPIISINATSNDETCDIECQNCLANTHCDYEGEFLTDIPEQDRKAVKECRMKRALKCVVIPERDQFKSLAYYVKHNKVVDLCIKSEIKHECKYEDEDLQDMCELGVKLVCRSIEKCLIKKNFKGEHEIVEECYNERNSK